MLNNIHDKIKCKMFQYSPNDENAINYLVMFYDNMFDDETISALIKMGIYKTGEFSLYWKKDRLSYVSADESFAENEYIPPLLIKVKGIKIPSEINNYDKYLVEELNKNLGPLGKFINSYNEWRDSMNKLLKDFKNIGYLYDNYPIVNKILMSPIEYYFNRKTVKGKRFTVTFKYN